MYQVFAMVVLFAALILLIDNLQSFFVPSPTQPVAEPLAFAVFTFFNIDLYTLWQIDNPFTTVKLVEEKKFCYVRKSYQLCLKILQMISIDQHTVEDAIIQEIENLKGLSNIPTETEISEESKPGLLGVRSQILVDIMGKLEELLNVAIPNNCYLFRERDGVTELSIAKAAEKLIKIATHAK